MKLLTLLASGSVLLAASAASAQVVANPNPAAAQAGQYAIEPVHTRVLFSLSHVGLSTWYGDFTDVNGLLSLDPKHPDTSTLTVSLPITSISTTNSKLDGELKSAEWLDAANSPTASFRSTKVAVTQPGHAEVTGEFTLHSVTKPLTLHVSFNGAGINPIDKRYTAGFEARGSFHRSDFGATKYAPLIGDDVDLIISSVFVKSAS